MKFSHVIASREDAIVFRDFHLSPIVQNRQCDISTRDCLSWNGVNMRMQIMTRSAAAVFYCKRIDYISAYVRNVSSSFNPEKTEKLRKSCHGVEVCEKTQAQLHNISTCSFNMSDFPVQVARYLPNGSLCFLKKELLVGKYKPCFIGSLSDWPLCPHQFYFDKRFE